jgi:hypothetical protein
MLGNLEDERAHGPGQRGMKFMKKLAEIKP